MRPSLMALSSACETLGEAWPARLWQSRQSIVRLRCVFWSLVTSLAASSDTVILLAAMNDVLVPSALVTVTESMTRDRSSDEV